MLQPHVNTPLVNPRAIVRTTLWLSATDAATLVAFAALSIAIGRLLGAEQLGIYSFAMALGILLQTIADAGYSISLSRSVAQQPASIETLLNAATATKLLLWALALPVALGLAALHSTEALALVAVVMVDVAINSVSFSIQSALRGIEQYVVPALLSNGYACASAGIAAAVVGCGGGVLGATLALCTIDTVRAVHLHHYLRRLTGAELRWRSIRQHLRWEQLRTQLELQRWVWWINIASSLMHRIPTVALGLRSSASEVGYFSAAYRIYSGLRIVPGALFNAVLPRLSSPVHHARAATQVMLWSTVAALGIAAMLWLSAPALIRVTFGFEQAVVPLQWLAVAFAGLFIKTAAEAVVLGRMHDRAVSFVVSLSAGVAVAAAWLVSPDAVSFSIVTVVIEWFAGALLLAWLTVR